MRGFVQKTTAAGMAVLLVLTLGCGNNNNNDQARGRSAPEPGYGPPPASSSRVNLHPMSNPPPGSQQPLQGYAPTRITTSGPQYNPGYQDTVASAPPAPGYAGGTSGGYGPTYSQPGYVGASYTPPYTAGPSYTAQGQDPFLAAGSASGPFRTAGGAYCTVEDVTAYSNPNVPMGDPPVIVNTPTGGVAYGRGYQDPVHTPGRPIYGQVEGTADIVVPVSALSRSTYTVPASTYTPPATTTYAPTTYSPPLSAATTYSPPTTTYAPTTTYSPPATTYSPPATTSPVYAPPLSSTAPAPAYGAGSALTPVPTSLAASSAMDASGFRLVPAPDVPPKNHPSDVAPSQWFEIIRPGNGPIRIGRVSSTCVCVGVRVPNRFVAAGERALIEARIVSRPQVNNLTYGIYVSVLEPVQTMVDADVTINL